ncbi:hypothetical protein BRAS3843_3100017 [Bradyrhizobium sp. STM 3843]|nr:hypothetical protein BRAS3843_3100017 [Bradyrhizobium sp. STM 3843]
MLPVYRAHLSRSLSVNGAPNPDRALPPLLSAFHLGTVAMHNNGQIVSRNAKLGRGTAASRPRQYGPR